MFVRISLIVPLLLSLLCAGLTAPSPRAVEQREAGACVGMECLKACCTMKTCCDSARQQEAPKSPESLAARPELQLIAPSFQVFAEVYVRPGRASHFITADEWSGAHAPPPLARSCIQLI
jgi:hypothetical protein